MKSLQFIEITMVLLVAMTITGCETKQLHYSGFLRDYSKLKPNPDIQGAMRYIDPTVDLSQYRIFIIDPIQVHLTPNAEGVSINPRELHDLTDYFHTRLIEKLTSRYEVAETPGPNTLRLKIAITDIEKSNPLLNIHPATKLSGLGLGGATMEAEAIDSQTLQCVAAIVDAREGNRLAITEGLSEFGHAKQVIDHWIQRFARTLDVAHGYSSK